MPICDICGTEMKEIRNGYYECPCCFSNAREIEGVGIIFNEEETDYIGENCYPNEPDWWKYDD